MRKRRNITTVVVSLVLIITMLGLVSCANSSKKIDRGIDKIEDAPEKVITDNFNFDLKLGAQAGKIDATIDGNIDVKLDRYFKGNILLLKLEGKFNKLRIGSGFDLFISQGLPFKIKYAEDKYVKCKEIHTDAINEIGLKLETVVNLKPKNDKESVLKLKDIKVLRNSKNENNYFTFEEVDADGKKLGKNVKGEELFKYFDEKSEKAIGKTLSKEEVVKYRKVFEFLKTVTAYDIDDINDRDLKAKNNVIQLKKQSIQANDYVETILDMVTSTVKKLVLDLRDENKIDEAKVTKNLVKVMGSGASTLESAIKELEKQIDKGTIGNLQVSLNNDVLSKLEIRHNLALVIPKSWLGNVVSIIEDIKDAKVREEALNIVGNIKDRDLRNEIEITIKSNYQIGLPAGVDVSF